MLEVLEVGGNLLMWESEVEPAVRVDWNYSAMDPCQFRRNSIDSKNASGAAARVVEAAQRSARLTAEWFSSKQRGSAHGPSSENAVLRIVD
jgi:hypothetical protein